MSSHFKTISPKNEIKYMREVNTRDGEELFKPKDNIGTRTNGCKLTVNKFKLRIERMFLVVRAMRFCNGFFNQSKLISTLRKKFDCLMKIIELCSAG